MQRGHCEVMVLCGALTAASVLSASPFQSVKVTLLRTPVFTAAAAWREKPQVYVYSLGLGQVLVMTVAWNPTCN